MFKTIKCVERYCPLNVDKDKSETLIITRVSLSCENIKKFSNTKDEKVGFHDVHQKNSTCCLDTLKGIYEKAIIA